MKPAVFGLTGTFRRFRRSSVRSRSTTAVVVVVAVAMAIGTVILLLLLQRALITAVSDTADIRAADVATRISTEGTATLSADLAESTRSTQVIQVLNASGQVVAASSPRATEAALTHLRPAPGTTQRTDQGAASLIDDDHLITARGASHDDQRYIVVVASMIETQHETVTTVATYLLIGFLPLLVIVGITSWMLTGRALRPVGQIQAQVRTIGSGDLTGRVPVPPTDDEIARLATTMNEMLERLQSSQVTQRRFVSDASHELRSPLATLTAAIQLVRTDVSSTRWSELHQVLETETNRMQRLVEDLLVLAKADDTGLPMQRVDVDLDDLIEAEIRRLRSSDHQLHVTGTIRPVRVTGDPLRLSQLIRNLVDNATRAARSTIHLSITRQERSAILVIEDDGDGIPEADQQRVFERFVRLDTSRARASGGSGLGLSIVHEITRSHRGTIVLTTSPLTGGTVATVALPLG